MTNLEIIRTNVMKLLDRRFSDDFDITLFANTHPYVHIMAVHHEDKFEFTILIGEGDELIQALRAEISGSANEIYVIHSESDQIDMYRKHVSAWDGTLMEYKQNIAAIEIETDTFGHTLEDFEIYYDVDFEEAII